MEKKKKRKKTNLGIKLLQESFFILRNSAVQVGLQEFKLFGQEHTKKTKKKPWNY